MTTNINVETFKKQVYDRIMNRIVDNPEDYVDMDGSINIDEESVFETCFDKEADLMELPTWMREKLFEDMVGSFEYVFFFDGAREVLKEVIADMKEWQKGEMSYYGLSQKDFI
jgi:hypothetical protein